ncbi:MAG: ribose-phosphate diphosphokinase [Pseudomonadota bacterium]
MKVIGFPGYVAQSRALADALGADAGEVEVHSFPDGESRIRLVPPVSGHLVLYCSLDRPNAKLVELLLAAGAARDLGVEILTLVAPYLCYMRQDKAFRPGEAVSQRILGGLLGRTFDRVVTLDPHLHRVKDLGEVLPGARATALSAAPLMADYLVARSEGSGEDHPLLLGPDAESEQWVGAVAAGAGLEYAVASKVRAGERAVQIRLPERSFAGRRVILVDDVASTGTTLEMAAGQLREAGTDRVDALVSHALFVGDALRRLAEAGVTDILSTDSIPHPSNRIPLAPLLARALKQA